MLCLMLCLSSVIALVIFKIDFVDTSFFNFLNYVRTFGFGFNFSGGSIYGNEAFVGEERRGAKNRRAGHERARDGHETGSRSKFEFEFSIMQTC